MSRKQLIKIERPALDLSKLHFKSERNGILILGTWLFTDQRWRPCMVLLHANRPIQRGRTIPVVIPLSEAWRWAMHGEVGDPAHCVAQIIEWTHHGYLPGNPASKKDHMRIMDAIDSRLPDLIAMPPRPKGETVAIGEATMINAKTGEVIDQREVRNDV